MSNIVLFGGSFDPIHNGHLALARAAAALPNVEQVLLTPVFQPPHKAGEPAASTTDRLEMCRLAAAESPHVSVCDYEVKKEGKSYTVQTLCYLRDRYPMDDLFLLCGADMLVTLQSWKDYERIIRLATILAVRRQGESDSAFAQALAALERDGARVRVLPCDPPGVSSSTVRLMLAKAENPAALLPRRVYDYILRHALYEAKDPMTHPFVGLLRGRLCAQRFAHSFAVADEAVRLAAKYGGDAHKAYLAGLLHDVMKDTPAQEQLQTLSQFGIIQSNVEKAAPKLWHAAAGALYVRHALGVDDSDIIAAIRYHTTGRRSMSLLEKILFLADFTSADRDYPGVDEIRRAVDASITGAMIQTLRFTICDLAERNLPIHPNTLDAYNEALLEKDKGKSNETKKKK